MATLDLQFSDYYTKVSEFLGHGSSPTGTNLTKVKEIVYRGYRKFLYPIHPGTSRRHVWSWLKKQGTIQLISGQWQYALPSDFGSILRDMHYGTNNVYRPLEKVSRDMILKLRTRVDHSSWPKWYSVVPTNFSKEVGQKWDVWVYETPNEVQTLYYTYQIDVKKPENDTDQMVGGQQASEALLECCLAIAELQEDDQLGIHNQVAQQMLDRLILHDTVDLPDTLGHFGPTYKMSRRFLRPIDGYND